MAGQTPGPRLPNVDQSSRDRIGEASDVDTPGESAFGMLISRLDSMRQRFAKLALQLDHVRQGVSEVHHAVDPLDNVAVARVEVDHRDLTMLRGQNPVKGLRRRLPGRLPGAPGTTFQGHRGQHDEPPTDGEHADRQPHCAGGTPG